jgi:hypothetical protein
VVHLVARGARPLYIEYAAELTALIGAPAYADLAQLCASRLAQGLVAEHPATAAARAEGLVRDEPAREPATPVHRRSSPR